MYRWLSSNSFSSLDLFTCPVIFSPPSFKCHASWFPFLHIHSRISSPGLFLELVHLPYHWTSPHRCLVGNSQVAHITELMVPLRSLQPHSPLGVPVSIMVPHLVRSHPEILSLTSENQSISKSNGQDLHNLCSTTPFPIFFATTFLGQPTIISHLSNCISLLTGFPSFTLRCLLCTFHRKSRIIFRKEKYTSFLKILSSLPITE